MSQSTGIDFSHIVSCYVAFAFQMTWSWLHVLVPIVWGTGRGKQPPLQEIHHPIPLGDSHIEIAPKEFPLLHSHPQLYIPGPIQDYTNAPPQLIFGSVSQSLFRDQLYQTNCIMTYWGDMNKSLFIPDRTLTDQRKDPNQVYLGELVSSWNLLTGVWLKVAYRGMDNSKAAASLELPAQLVDSSGG